MSCKIFLLWLRKSGNPLVDGAESMAEQKHSARLGKTFPVGCLVDGLLGRGERLRKRLKLSTAQIISPVS